MKNNKKNNIFTLFFTIFDSFFKKKTKKSNNYIINSIKNKKNDEDINVLYKKSKKIIDYHCYNYSKYYNIDMGDLLSESNIIFYNCYKLFYSKQIQFTTFFKEHLKKNLFYYCCNVMRKRKKEQKLKQKLVNEYINIDNRIEIKIQYKPEMGNEINKIINEIISFCLQPDFKNELCKYKNKYRSNNKVRQNKIKPSKNLIKHYFNDVFGYSYNSLDEAIQGIKNILKEGLI